MVECGSAGVWDRGIKGMWNVFMRSEVYCLLYGDVNSAKCTSEVKERLPSYIWRHFLSPFLLGMRSVNWPLFFPG
jgi:hypothetical protein